MGSSDDGVAVGGKFWRARAPCGGSLCGPGDVGGSLVAMGGVGPCAGGLRGQCLSGVSLPVWTVPGSDGMARGVAWGPRVSSEVPAAGAAIPAAARGTRPARGAVARPGLGLAPVAASVPSAPPPRGVPPSAPRSPVPACGSRRGGGRGGAAPPPGSATRRHGRSGLAPPRAVTSRGAGRGDGPGRGGAECRRRVAERSRSARG